MNSSRLPADVLERSNRVVALFQSIKNLNLDGFPVPPFTKWLGGRILDAKRGKIEVEYLVRPEMVNPTGLLHGGMQSGMIDDTIGLMSATLGYKGFLISINLHVDYLGKVKVGEKVVATGNITREGRRIVHANVVLTAKDGTVVANGGANLLITTYVPDYVKRIDGDGFNVSESTGSP
ncbi:MAG: PaaI family thioesterase [Promethearchaeota archaeon]